MKRVVTPSNNEANQLNYVSINDVPDIANKPLTLDAILSWIDTLVEVSNNAENIRDN